MALLSPGNAEELQTAEPPEFPGRLSEKRDENP